MDRSLNCLRVQPEHDHRFTDHRFSHWKDRPHQTFHGSMKMIASALQIFAIHVQRSEQSNAEENSTQQQILKPSAPRAFQSPESSTDLPLAHARRRIVRIRCDDDMGVQYVSTGLVCSFRILIITCIDETTTRAASSNSHAHLVDEQAERSEMNIQCEC